MKEKGTKKQGNANQRQGIIDYLVISSLQFRNIRIKHNLLIFGLFLTRTFFATILNLLLISKMDLSVVNYLQRLWYSLQDFVFSAHSISFYVAVPLVCIVILVSIVFCTCSQNLEIRKFGLGFLGIYHYFSPFFIRFVTMVSFQAWKNLSVLFGILGLFYILVNFVSEILLSLISANSNPRSENNLSGQYKTTVFMKEMSECLLVIILQIMSNYGIQKQIRILLILLHGLVCLLPLKVVFMDFIYHNEDVTIIFIFKFSLQISLCMLFLMRELLENSFYGQNFVYVIFGVSLFVFIGIRSFVNFRDQKIQLGQKDMVLQGNNLNIYLHVLASSLQNLQNQNKLRFVSNMLRNQHRQVCVDMGCFCRNDRNGDKMSKQLQYFLIKNKIKKMSESSMITFEQIIFCCYINLVYFEGFPDLLGCINNFIRFKQLSWFQNIQYCQLKKQIQYFLNAKRNRMNGISIELVQQQDRIILNLLNNFQCLCNVKLKFWVNLSKPYPDLKVIQQMGKREMGIKTKIQDKIQLCIRNYCYSNALMEILCLYEVYIQLAPKLPKYLLKSQQNLALARNQKIKVLKAQNFGVDMVMYEKYCVIFESEIERNRMGIISNVSKNITKVFGYVKQDIIGKNINEIMPKSMQKQHDNILESWRERVSWQNVHKIRYILAMTKQNVCFESVIYLSIIQRNDSINLFALFVKANENSYMIVNDQGNIDGVGMDFIDIFGNRVAKLPLSYVCLEAKEIMEKAQRNGVETMEVNIFHVKGLQREIDIYQHSKYQMKYKNQSSESVLLEQIQTQERHSNLKIEVKRYMMGKKMFVLIRLIEAIVVNSSDQVSLNENIHDSFRNAESYELNKNATKYNIIRNQQINCVLGDIDGQDQTESISSQKNDDGVAWQKIISNLKARTKNKSKFRSKGFESYFLIILFVCLLAIVILIVENKISSAKYEEMREYTKRGTRFMYIMESFTLAHTRAQNIELFRKGMNSSMIKNVIYQISRIYVELVRIQLSLYQKGYGLVNIDELMLDKKIKWKISQNQDVEIDIYEYYSNYMQEFKKLRQSLLDQRGLESLEFMVRNYRNMIDFIGRNLQILDDRIYSVLTQIIIIECVKYLLLLLLVFISICFLWRSKMIQQRHKQSIRKIVLSVSDKNCQSCSVYYRKVLCTLAKCQAYADSTKNSAEFVMKYLVEEIKLQDHLKELVIYKDQIQKNKFMKLKTDRIPKMKLFLVFMAGLFVLQMSLSSGIRLNFLMKNREFYRFYIKLIQNQNSNFEQFEYLKTYLFSETSSTLQFQQISRMYFDSLNSQASNNYFINLFILLQEISTPNDVLLPFLQNKINLCQLAKGIDVIFFKQWCNSESSYPFNRFSLIEINTMIQNYIRQMLSLLLSARKLDEDSERLIFIVEQALTLKISYFYQFSLTLSAWASEVYADNKNSQSVYRILLISMLSVFIVVCYRLQVKMGGWLVQSYFMILVLPETVLRRTKRAMKNISDLMK